MLQPMEQYYKITVVLALFVTHVMLIGVCQEYVNMSVQSVHIFCQKLNSKYRFLTYALYIIIQHITTKRENIKCI